jgi:GDP-D-mannose dehydratase
VPPAKPEPAKSETTKAESIHPESSKGTSRPNEATRDASKAAEKLGWKPKTRFRDLVAEMVRSDLALLPQERRRRPSADD